MPLVDHLRPGDRILVGQGAAEPASLVRELVVAARSIPDLTVLCGYSLSPDWLSVAPGTLRVVSYLAHGPLRKLASRGLVDILPWNYSRLEQAVRSRELRADVVLLQVSPADADGNHSFGPTVDHVALAAGHARLVLAEVNPRMPATTSRFRLHRSRITEAIEVNQPLLTEATPSPTEAEQQVAAHVAELVPDGSTVQLGIGGLAGAIGTALQARKGLRIRTGIAGDWLAGLHRASALDTDGRSVVGVALGTAQLYDFLDRSETVHMGPISEQTDTSDPAWRGPLFAINSAVEVDVIGQVGAEVAGSRFVGGIGGQVDFLRAARGTVGGRGIIALTSATAQGASRIVTRLAGPTTSLKSDVDLVITEWGTADLRMATLKERFDRLVAIAHPSHRDELIAQRPAWL